LKVQVVRRGGFAGIPLRGEVDTADLGSRRAAAAEAALRRLSVGKPAAPPAHPDSFQYELTFPGGTVVLDESEVCDDLRPLIDKAMEQAQPGASGGELEG
jgi:hypothetical protein